MAEDWGSGVSRTLSALNRQFSGIVWQKARPPLDSELNLMSQAGSESLRQLIRSQMPSGFFLDPTRAAADYQFDPNWSNLFKLGNPRVSTGVFDTGGEKQPVIWANINGWVIPVVGSFSPEGDLSNVIQLLPPPESNSRIDYVFLEAWSCRVNSNPSTANKPSKSTLYFAGNTQYGGTNLPDDLEDPTVGYQTTGRIQVQYRLRIQGGGSGLGSSVALDVYPDGLGDPYIYGQGTSATPVAGLGNFTNMREALGDPSLWRAGDGNPNNSYGTVDGYVYAVPVCAIFRRNSSAYVAVNGSHASTQNGGFNRTPGARFPPNPTARELTTATLTAAMLPTDSFLDVAVTGFNGSGFEDTHQVWGSTFLTIDDEIIGVDSVDLVGHTIHIPVGGRGRYGTTAVGHSAGATIKFYNTRPDGLYSDQITQTDVLDLRHAVNTQDWDFDRLLAHNVAALAKGNLRSSWKLSATGPTQGTVVHEVDYMYASHAADVPHDTMAVDGPDGIRTVWSDAATLQPDVTVLCAKDAAQAGNGTVGITNGTFDTTVSWDVGADFHPSGFMNSGGAATWTDGTTILLFTGGQTGDKGVRGTFRQSGTRGVRLLTPKEYWKTGFPTVDPSNGSQTPVTLRFEGYRAFEPAPEGIITVAAARHVGPMFPWRETNFERPFIVLGGVLNTNLKLTVAATDLSNPSLYFEIDLGIDFSVPGAWFYTDPVTGEYDDDPKNVLNPLFHGLRTMYGMLTDSGRDSTGLSSELYVVLMGDNVDQANNGAFKVIGVGPVGASGNTKIRVVALSPEFTAFNTATGVVAITVEMRSQYTHSEDVSSYDTKWADVAIVLTDVGGKTEHPWKREYLGSGEAYDLSMPLAGGGVHEPVIDSNLLISTTFIYHPGHGATARVADDLVRFSRVGDVDTNGSYLRQAPASLDPTFVGATGAPSNETFWDPNHVQLWNRLSGMGWFAPFPDSGPVGPGGQVIGFTEQDREHELFIDKGSKTIIFRPFRSRDMTLQTMTYTDIIHSGCLLGPYTYPISVAAKDPLVLWTGTTSTGKKMGFAVPREFMPRFGRQDIPYYRDIGGDPRPFLPGINHLFKDNANTASPVFSIIGGLSNLGTGGVVKTLLFLTGDAAGVELPYAISGTTDAPTNNQPFIGARKTTSINPATPFAPGIIANLAAVNSSDFGRGLRGIQLPPYYGPARVIGVYDMVDFESQAGHTIAANRIDPDSDPAPNLLREDADQQTLFILEDGAKDLTGEDEDHTYIIPENVLDLTRSLTWDPAHPQDFADFHFVVVAEVFGFARGFISKNNYVLVRKYDGSGTGNVDAGGQTDVALPLVPMVIPCPAAYNEQFYTAYNRTVYQGDVFMSREGNATASDDYDERYGQLTSAQQYALRTPIEQYDNAGIFVPQTPNARVFEVLSSMDFYTTLGTGKIGGQLYPGTMLDVGFVQNSPDAALRKPDASDAPMWQVLSRSFTEGQKSSDNRACLDLALNDTDSLDTSSAGLTTKKAFIKFKLLDGTIAKLWFTRLQSRTVMETAYGAENVILIDETVKPQEIKGSYTFPNPTTLKPGQTIAGITVSVPGVVVGDTVLVSYLPNAPMLGIVYIHGQVLAPDVVTLVATHVVTPTAFEQLISGGLNQLPAIIDVTLPGSPIAIPAHGSVQSAPQTFTGLALAKGQALAVGYVSVGFDTQGLVFTASVTGNDQYVVTIHNTTAALVSWVVDPLRVVAFEPFNEAGYTLTLTNQVVGLRVLHTPTGNTNWSSVESFTATTLNALVKILEHPSISRSLTLRIDATPVLHFQSVATGAAGNNIQIEVGTTDPDQVSGISFTLRLSTPYNNESFFKYSDVPLKSVTKANLVGGRDIAINAGSGTSQVHLTGMTERLPLGALLQDSDFLCENPLVDDASAMKASPTGPRPIQSIIPLTNGGNEYTRFMGEPGELLAQSDGSVCVTDFSAWTQNNPTGSRIFRLYRGGGPAFVLSGDNPGGPVDWVSETFPAALTPVLKGGALACRAMLVRNFHEETQPHSGPVLASEGDEIQMVIITQGVLGDFTVRDKGVTLSGVISPSGYGEGYAASDRFRIAGRPMFKGTNRQVPNPADVTLAVYPDKQR